MHITGIYAALSALLVVVLSTRVVLRRLGMRIPIGDGDDRELRKRIRAQGNAIEYLPLALLLLLLLELNQTRPDVVHLLGIAVVVARVAHAIGLSRTSGPSALRVIGTALTLLLLSGMGLLLLWQFAQR